MFFSQVFYVCLFFFGGEGEGACSFRGQVARFSGTWANHFSGSCVRTCWFCSNRPLLMGLTVFGVDLDDFLICPLGQKLEDPMGEAIPSYSTWTPWPSAFCGWNTLLPSVVWFVLKVIFAIALRYYVGPWAKEKQKHPKGWKNTFKRSKKHPKQSNNNN